MWVADKVLCENWANDLIRRHNSKRFVEPAEVDVYDLIDIVDARLSLDYLTPSRKYLGATVFRDCNLLVWPDNPYFSGMLPYYKYFKNGTIIVDRNLAESTADVDIKIANFTFLHEMFHLCNHGTQIGENYHLTQSSMKTSNKLEQEANYGASVFWMPERAVKIVFLNSFGLSSIPNTPLPFCRDTKVVIQKMAQLFGVNYTPMVYRLQELNLIDRYWSRI